jgi:hypothetical protein
MQRSVQDSIRNPKGSHVTENNKSNEKEEEFTSSITKGLELSSVSFVPPEESKSLANYIREKSCSKDKDVSLKDNYHDSQSTSNTQTDRQNSNIFYVVDDIDTKEFQCIGKLTLVDLAGSERNYETLRMKGQQHK